MFDERNLYWRSFILIVLGVLVRKRLLEEPEAIVIKVMLSFVEMVQVLATELT